MVPGADPLGIATRLSVLVIDDDQDVRQFLEDFLHGEGFMVTLLADPSLAIERIRDEVFHLIMLDLIMPKITGFDLLPQIRAVDDNIAVIAMTTNEWLETMSIQHGASACICHPFIPACLREVIGGLAKMKDFRAAP